MRINLVGFGIIGKGFARTLLKKREWLKDKYGFEAQVVSISDITGTVSDENGLDLNQVMIDFEGSGRLIDVPGSRKDKGLDAIKDVDADLLVEVTPTNVETGEPGLSHILEALKMGKHVVTSNKGPLALEFKKLKDASERYGVKLRYEASAGGAMPLINLANNILSGDEVLSIKGILNGTTNYILTRMTKEGTSFEATLREAKDLGIAESDPTYDVTGSDTACKLVILANAIMGKEASYGDVKIRGINSITPEAVALALEEGYVIKLVGEVENDELEVAPKLVPVNHPLNVDGTLNVATLRTDLAGDITVVGTGAGAKETNSAILSDILNIFRNSTG